MLKVDGQVVGRVAETIGSRIGGQDVHRLAADIDLKRRPDRLHILFSGQSTHPVLLALVAMDKECGVNRIQPPRGSLFDPSLQHFLLFGAQGGRSSGISSCQTDSQRTLPSGSPAWITASCLDPFMAEAFFERSKPPLVWKESWHSRQ